MPPSCIRVGIHVFWKHVLYIIIVNSLIVCKLDYCNSLYWGCNRKELEQLQLIQNSAAKAVFGLYKHEHVGDSLNTLHWLPIKQRIVFKLMLLVYKSLNGMGPDYLNELLNYANYTHLPLLLVPRVNTSIGERAFMHSAPKLWNLMPKSVKTCTSLQDFKSALKTHLFTINAE